ncbi:S24 family peptidase [Roseospirillum parvum]|uniref:Phage repressor protein C, contains Cro/C1-type HTH and peptisase s24 domains n=1 Tax=Roseospirillum parvum TaxID=83401 RepID=A0A1G8G7E8_9PROT|nr:helix-turn-helix transcriptional regulator [Roseospirillum parvum]SDH90334.1 Phage repressor protein C, contains Cro/C1-type HTH and peptisase s24 domains [Roseospirillum parvum]
MGPDSNQGGLAERLRLALGDESVNALAGRSGVRESSIRQYLAGSIPGADKAAQLAAALGVSIDWLVTGAGPKTADPLAPVATPELLEAMVAATPERLAAARADRSRPRSQGTPQPPPVAGDYVLVPRFNVEASAGHGAWNDREQVVDFMAFRADWVRRALGADPNQLALIAAAGDSMEPSIRAGDLLLIDTGVTRVIDDAVYVLLSGSELLVKRVQKFLSGALTIKSDNPAYAPENLTPAEAETLCVAGRVRWIGRLI